MELHCLNKYVKIVQDNKEYFEAEINAPTIYKFVSSLDELQVILKKENESKLGSFLQKLEGMYRNIMENKFYTNLEDISNNTFSFIWNKKEKTFNYVLKGKAETYIDPENVEDDELNDADFSMALLAFRGWDTDFIPHPFDNTIDIIRHLESDNYFTFEISDCKIDF